MNKDIQTKSPILKCCISKHFMTLKDEKTNKKAVLFPGKLYSQPVFDFELALKCIKCFEKLLQSENLKPQLSLTLTHAPINSNKRFSHRCFQNHFFRKNKLIFLKSVLLLQKAGLSRI